MSFILYECLEGYQLGKQLGVFDSWEALCEVAEEMFCECQWGPSAVDPEGNVWYFTPEDESMEEFYQDKEDGKVPENTRCYTERWYFLKQREEAAKQAKLDQEWCLVQPEWGDWYMVPVDKHTEFIQWCVAWNGNGEFFPDAKEVDLQQLSFKQPKIYGELM